MSATAALIESPVIPRLVSNGAGLFPKPSNGIAGTTVFRGVLALAVALHHADIFRLGYFPLLLGRSAVIGFFVLSGWVVGWYFYSISASPTWAGTGQFYARRFLRLTPVLILNFILVAVIHRAVHWPDLAVLLPWGLEAPPTLYTHVLWTLFVEIQFYILAPLVILLMSWLPLSLPVALATYLLLFVAPRLEAFGMSRDGVLGILDQRSLICNGCYFFAGLWYCRSVWQKSSTLLSRLSRSDLFVSIAAVYALAALLFPISPLAYLVGGVHGAVLGALLVIELSRRIGGAGAKSIRNLLWRALFGLGVISYGYYVFHGFCYTTGKGHYLTALAERLHLSWGPGSPGFIFLVVGFPLLLALASYFWVETPVENLRRFLPKPAKEAYRV